MSERADVAILVVRFAFVVKRNKDSSDFRPTGIVEPYPSVQN